MSMQEYAEAAAHDHQDMRMRDERGRVQDLAAMTDREIAEESLNLLRGLHDMGEQLVTQMGPTLMAMQNGPLGKLFGGGR